MHMSDNTFPYNGEIGHTSVSFRINTLPLRSLNTVLNNAGVTSLWILGYFHKCAPEVYDELSQFSIDGNSSLKN